MENELHRIVEQSGLVMGGGITTPTPAQVDAVRKALPAAWREHFRLIVDLVVGTRKSLSLGKARDGFVYTVVMAEQATHPRIAEWHAAPFAGCKCVVEACTGAGVDAAALARVAQRVITFEANPVHAMIARANLHNAGCENVVVVARSVPSEEWTNAVAEADGLWADPSRRSAGGQRARKSVEYSPPLEAVMLGIDTQAVVGLKVGPADALPPGLVTGMSSTWVGFRGEARERTLWRNANDRDVNRVYLADEGVEWTIPSEHNVPTERSPNVGDILVEPHNAIIASGSVGAWFAHHGMQVLDTRIGYGLLNHDPGASPWYERWRICRVESGIDRKHLQRSLRELGWGPGTVIKKRGVDIDPMDLHRSLVFAPRGPEGAIILARTDAGRYTIYAQRPA